MYFYGYCSRNAIFIRCVHSTDMMYDIISCYGLQLNRNKFKLPMKIQRYQLFKLLSMFQIWQNLIHEAIKFGVLLYFVNMQEYGIPPLVRMVRMNLAQHTERQNWVLDWVSFQLVLSLDNWRDLICLLRSFDDMIFSYDIWSQDSGRQVWDPVFYV